MSVWSTANSSPTKDPRVRVGQWGKVNWRTLVRDGDDWDITGPPYPTRVIAEGHVDDVLADYFGELPSRALLAGRIEQAVVIARDAFEADSTELPRHVIVRMVEALTGSREALYSHTDLREEDLEVSTVRPGAIPHGSGGQTTGQFDSYVRVTHRPTGITVERDSERSQLMNKSAALDELRRQLAGRQAEPDLREHITRLHPDLYDVDKARAVNTTQGRMAFDHAEDHRDHGSTTHRHGPSHWERPDAQPAGWRDGSGVVLLDGMQ